ncbi:MAG: ATP-binding protein, partial [Thermomicrobiales bacterium]
LAAALAFRDARRGRSEGQATGPAAFLAAALDAELPFAAWPLPPGLLETLATHPALAQPLRARLGTVLAQARGQVIADEGQQAAAWADAIVMLARTAPEGLVLAIEDLHWAAPAFVGALAALVDRMCGERAGDLPLLLVLTWRPADLHEPRLGSPHPALAFLARTAARFPGGDIDLQTAIGGEAGIAFVRAMLAQQGGGSPPPSFVAALAARTDGLPLFVTGMLRLLRERGLAGEGIGAPDRDLDWSAIPAELDALFRDRLGRLGPTVRDLLAWASVQGEQFAGEPLCMALGLELEVGFDLLDRDLARRDLVTAVGERSTNERRPDAPVEHVWAFAHALLRDFMLREMSPFERRRAHLRTADALIAIHGAEAHPCSDRIAWHLEQGGDLHRAATAWVRPGDQAVTDGDVLRADRHFAHVEAMGAAMANPPMLVQSYLGRATCARAMGDAVDALRFAEMGVARAREVGHAPVLANALQVASTIHFDRGRHLEGIAALREAQPIIEGLGDPVEGCRIECLLAFNLIAVGHYDEAMARAARAVGLADHVGTDRVGITARVALANVRVELGEYEAALLRYAEGVARAQRDGHAVSEALCWVNIGLCHVELGDATAATEALARVHDLGRELPVLGFVAAAHFDAAILAESLGRLDEAERAFRWSLDLREEIGQQALQMDSLAGLLRVVVARGDAGVVGPLLEQVEARLRAGGLIGSEHHGRLFLAVIRGNRLLGRADREAEVAGEAVAFLRGRLAHIGDARQRRSYLDGVPTHRALLAEIGAVLGGIPPDLRAEPGAVGCEVPPGATGHPAGADG